MSQHPFRDAVAGVFVVVAIYIIVVLWFAL
jgi:hypothetical protein